MKVNQLYTYIYIERDIDIDMDIDIPFQIIFHCSLLQDSEYSSLCYTVNACFLSILDIVVCIC